MDQQLHSDGLQKPTLPCTAGGCESVASAPFSLLSLPLSVPKMDRDSPLPEHMHTYIRGDAITDWTCPLCQCRHHAHRKADLWWPPPVVILRLKRFSFAGSTACNTDKQVSSPWRISTESAVTIGPHADTKSLVLELFEWWRTIWARAAVIMRRTASTICPSTPPKGSLQTLKKLVHL